MDENVHGAITEGLRRRGIDVLTVQEDGLTSAEDPAVMDRATELGRVVFTTDEDLLAEAAARQAAGVPFSGVIYAYQLGVTVGRCVEDLELIGVATEPVEYADRVQYLPLK
jgi:hypothetical protein